MFAGEAGLNIHQTNTYTSFTERIGSMVGGPLTMTEERCNRWIGSSGRPGAEDAGHQGSHDKSSLQGGPRPLCLHSCVSNVYLLRFFLRGITHNHYRRN